MGLNPSAFKKERCQEWTAKCMVLGSPFLAPFFLKTRLGFRPHAAATGPRGALPRGCGQVEPRRDKSPGEPGAPVITAARRSSRGSTRSAGSPSSDGRSAWIVLPASVECHGVWASSPRDRPQAEDSFKVAWSIYVGWMPWGYAADSRHRQKMGRQVRHRDRGHADQRLLESINQYTAGGSTAAP